MESLSQDLRYGVRALFKRPGLTLTAILMQALGIGACAAIFSLVNAVLLRSLPYDDPDRLVVMWESSPQSKQEGGVAPANFLDWRAQNQVFERMAAYTDRSFSFTGGDRPEQIEGAIVSASLFPLLGVKPILGRTFLPEEEQFDRARPVVLSNGLWQRRYGSDSGVLGQEMILNTVKYIIVGVMPPDFQYPPAAQLWVPPRRLVPDYPLNPNADAAAIRSHRYTRVIARLKREVTINQAQSEMDSIARRLEKQYPDTNTNAGVTLVPLRDYFFGNIKNALLLILGASGFALLITCSNIANLLIVRAMERQKEMSIRIALGANRLRIARQLMTESLLMGLAGGALGLLIAFWSVNALLNLSPERVRNINNIGIDWRVLSFTFIISILTGIIFGLIPALQVSRPNLSESLKEAGKNSTGGIIHNRIRSSLVVFEVTLSFVLLIATGLMIKSFLRLQEVNPGFDPKNVLTINLSLPQPTYSDRAGQAAFFKQALERIRLLPEVQAAGAVTVLPLSGIRSSREFTIEGRPQPDTKPYAYFRVISSGYFSAMGIPLLKGRDFSDWDNKYSPNRMIINNTMARRFWPDEDPVGKHLTIDIAGDSVMHEIIGIAGDVRHLGLEIEAQPEMYISYLESPVPAMALAIRSPSDLTSLVSVVKNEIWAVDKNQPVSKILSMEQLVSSSTAGRRFNTLLLSALATMSLVLAVVGIYGVMSYLVTQEARQIGIRMALGARASDVIKLVVGQGLLLALTGLAIGLAAAFALTRLMSSLLYGVSPADVRTYALTSLLFMTGALVACYIPARRAVKVDPMTVLRDE